MLKFHILRHSPSKDYSQTHLSQSLCVSVCGSRHCYSLPPLGSKEVLQVQLQRLQSGQLLREVDGLNGRMVGVPIQLFLQRSVDLVQRTQQKLETHEE